MNIDTATATLDALFNLDDSARRDLVTAIDVATIAINASSDGLDPVDLMRTELLLRRLDVFATVMSL